MDQFDRKWLKVQKGNKAGFGPLDELLGSSAQFYQRLAAQGVIVAHSATKNLVNVGAEGATFEQKVYVIDRLGWHEDFYVWPGRELPKQLGGLRVIAALPPGEARWSTHGSYEEWQQGVSRLATGQALPTFVLACAFAAPLQRLFPEIGDNIGFELFAATSVGKSKLLLLAGSVYGGSSFPESWSTTVAALEPTMALYGDALLLLNEAHLFLNGTEAKNRELGHAIFKLAEGTDKARYNAPASRRDHRFLFVTSTNKAIAEVVSGFDARTGRAIQVRLLTIPADAGAGLGIFDRLPRGCTDSADAVTQLGHLAGQHYGWAALAFLERLEKELHDPVKREALCRQLRGFIAVFVRLSRLPKGDGEAHRVAEKFGLVYAAGATSAPLEGAAHR